MTVTPPGAAAAGVASGVVAAAVGAGSVVTLTPMYVASHCAAAVSFPPLLSITCVTACVGALPPAFVAKPTMFISDAQRVVALLLRPLALTNVTWAPASRAAGVGKTSWTKWDRDLKLWS